MSPGPLKKTIKRLRENFPPSLTVKTLQQLGIASNSENSVINVLRFMELINSKGNKTNVAERIFLIHDNKEFEQEFSEQVKNSYSGLFQLRGDEAWTLDRNGLIQFFRPTDKTTARVGELQASTFQVLAEFAGYNKTSTSKSKVKSEKPKKKSRQKDSVKSKTEKVVTPLPVEPSAGDKESRNFGLTVRIEINLPAGGNKETYDNIFRSIRENLLNG